MKIKVNGTQLFFDIYGSKLKIYPDKIVEKPTLIVLHGGHGLVDHSLYVEFWSQFSEIAQVVFIDQRGCGRSDKAESNQWNLEHWGEDLYQFCLALEIEQPIVAGVSMGGHVMCEYIKHHPEHPGGLIFCNTEARFILEDVCNILRTIANEEVANICYLQFTKPTPEISKKYKEICVPYYAHNAYHQTELQRCKTQLAVFNHFSEMEMGKFDYTNDLSKICCPTLLLAGNDSPLHPPIRAKEMAAMIKPNLVSLEIVEQAGAAVYKDQPEQSYKIVEHFLKQFGENNAD